MSDQFLGSLIFLGAVGVVSLSALKLGFYIINRLVHVAERACETVAKISNGGTVAPRLDEAVNEVFHGNQLAVRPEQAVNVVSEDATLAHNVIDVEATEVKESIPSKKEAHSATSTFPRTEKQWQELYDRPTFLRRTELRRRGAFKQNVAAA